MLYTGVNPNVDQAPPIEFYEPEETTKRIAGPSVRLFATKKHKKGGSVIELYDEDVKGLLVLLRDRMQQVLQPLYIFIGMVAAALGKKDVKEFYKWKMPVRAYKEDNRISIEQFFEFHTHIPPDIMNYVIITHYMQTTEKKPEEETPFKYTTQPPSGLNEPSNKPVFSNALIGNNYEDESVLPFFEGSPNKDIYNLVLSFRTTGGLEMATQEKIHMATCKYN